MSDRDELGRRLDGLSEGSLEAFDRCTGEIRRLMPGCGEGTPSWNWDHGDSLLRVFGRQASDGRILWPKICLVRDGDDDAILLGAAAADVSAYAATGECPGFARLSWARWKKDGTNVVAGAPLGDDGLGDELRAFVAWLWAQRSRPRVSDGRTSGDGDETPHQPPDGREPVPPQAPETAPESRAVGGEADALVLDQPCYDFAQLVNITTYVHRGGAPRAVGFLNLRVSARTPLPGSRADYSGAGLYGITFADDGQTYRLIYVGKFRGTQADPFAGNVVRSRWWTHIGAFTLREGRLSLAEATLDYLASKHGEPWISAQPCLELLAHGSDLLKDRGCGAGLNRAIFALRRWDLFGPATLTPETQGEILRRFRICYLRVNPAIRWTEPLAIREAVSNAEKAVIGLLKPPCNDEAPRAATPRDDMQRFLDLARNELGARLARLSRR